MVAEDHNHLASEISESNTTSLPSTYSHVYNNTCIFSFATLGDSVVASAFCPDIWEPHQQPLRNQGRKGRVNTFILTLLAKTQLRATYINTQSRIRNVLHEQASKFGSVKEASFASVTLV